MAEIPHLSVGRKEVWEVNFPNASDRICSKYTSKCIPMYEIVFKKIGFRLPFSPLFVTLLQWLELCPSQSHPFTLILRPLSWCASICESCLQKTCFLVFFFVRRETDRKGGRRWVTFCQGRRLFVDFEGGSTDFKERFLLVRPRTEVALSNVLKTIEKPH